MCERICQAEHEWSEWRSITEDRSERECLRCPMRELEMDAPIKRWGSWRFPPEEKTQD
jgi:hypothetical protein